MDSEPNRKSLYRVEYFEPEDNASYVDWVWLMSDEVDSYRPEYKFVKVRRATKDEEDLYEEAYADGYGIAAIMEFESKDDGVTFRVELDKDKQDFSYTKMFKCSICGEHKDFETQVATANGFYLTELKGKDKDILWHVCYDCAMLQLEVDGIDIVITEEGEADS
jgi:hypothetical protein